MRGGGPEWTRTVDPREGPSRHYRRECPCLPPGESESSRDDPRALCYPTQVQVGHPRRSRPTSLLRRLVTKTFTKMSVLVVVGKDGVREDDLCRDVHTQATRPCESNFWVTPPRDRRKRRPHEDVRRAHQGVQEWRRQEWLCTKR